MKVYCMCVEAAKLPRTKNNDFLLGSGPVLGTGQYVVAGTPMAVTQVGRTQVLEGEDGQFYQHYPNVDLLRCPACGREVVIE